MIVFEGVRKNLAMLGCRPHQLDRHFLSNFGRIKVLSLNLLNFILYTLYAVYEANEFLEYINTIFLSSIQLLAFLSVSNCIWNAKDIHKLLDNIEKTINASK